MIVGIDDTDSLDGGCTTYLAALLCEKLKVKGLPRLIRLNPNIPYRTRGNGAVAFEAEGKGEEIKKAVLSLIEEKAHLSSENTNPGVVFIEDLKAKGKKKLRDFYYKAVSSEVSLEEARDLASGLGLEVHGFKSGRGIIGALAAAGSSLEDKTYEFIAYREERNYGKKRRIDEASIREMDERTGDETFNNIDPETGQILIIPKGKDPVLCGIRGESKGSVENAWSHIKALEGVERTQVFESNQGTDIHLREKKISELRPYDCAILEGEVMMDPQTIEGGHVLFPFSDGTGKIACAAYEPTGSFRERARRLMAGDRVRVYGGIGQYPNTLNLEKLEVLVLSGIREKRPPECCGKKMTSAGKDKGYKCKRCGRKEKDGAYVELERQIKPGTYHVPLRAMRHLSKPPSRGI